jgi:YfiH family protein
MAGFLTADGLASFLQIEHGFGMRDSLLPPDLALLKQIHSDVVLTATHSGPCGDGDGLITDLPGLSISIRTADCYPILLVDDRNRAVAAVHAGWRGTAARIVQKTLASMRKMYGTEPGDVQAAIGPGIGRCCYEVGPEVARQFGHALDQQTHLDLVSENRKQLEDAGVPAGKIEALGVCTFCDAKRFFSYRREREQAGRMTSFIRIVSPEIKPR